MEIRYYNRIRYITEIRITIRENDVDLEMILKKISQGHDNSVTIYPPEIVHILFETFLISQRVFEIFSCID